MSPRTHLNIVTLGLVICLIGGALLFAKTYETAQSNSKFICTFGAAISKEPLKPRNAETDKEFKTRVQATRQFVRRLESELDDCQQPTVIVVDPKAKDKLHNEKAIKGGSSQRGGGHSNGSPPSSPTGPPPGGPTPPANPQPPSQPPNPPSEPEPLDPVLDPVCNLTDDLGLPVCL